MTPLQMGQLIHDAAKLREDSFDLAQAAKEKNAKFPNYEKCYKLTMLEAAKQACGTELKEFVPPLYLLLSNAWNEALDWATHIKLKEGK